MNQSLLSLSRYIRNSYITNYLSIVLIVIPIKVL